MYTEGRVKNSGLRSSPPQPPTHPHPHPPLGALQPSAMAMSHSIKDTSDDDDERDLDLDLWHSALPLDPSLETPLAMTPSSQNLAAAARHFLASDASPLHASDSHAYNGIPLVFASSFASQSASRIDELRKPSSNQIHNQLVNHHEPSSSLIEQERQKVNQSIQQQHLEQNNVPHNTNFHQNGSTHTTKYRPNYVGEHHRFRCHRATVIVAMIALLVTAVCLDAYFLRSRDPVGCLMSYMRPEYIRMVDFDHRKTKFGRKYTLYLYKDRSYSVSTGPEGTPVIFIPGNAGSHKQIRSLASESATEFWKSRQSHKSATADLMPFDFFTVDFNEELSAFHGNSLLEQAEYLNDAIQYILTLYKSRSIDSIPAPSSVTLVCHSMGGVVARAMFTLSNFKIASVNTIFTLATPHIEPPATFQW